MSARGDIICHSSSYCLVHPPRSSPAIKHRLSRTVFLRSSAFKGSLFIDVNTQRINNGGAKKLCLQVVAASCIGRPFRWWEKGLQPNMREIHSAHEFMLSLTNAGNRLVVVGFYSPWCGTCRALHPKVCQLAASNPDVEFLMVNFEDNRAMCYGLHIHVLPYFQFYRGPKGLLCTFTCTIATIKRFKDALAKHNTDRCSVGPARDLGNPELQPPLKHLSMARSISQGDTEQLVGGGYK